MPDLIRPTFTVDLGGETLPLRFEVRDWIAAEKRLGVALYPFGKTDWWRQNGGAIGLSLYADLLVVGLIHHKPDISIDWVLAQLTDPLTLDQVNVRVGEAVFDFFRKAGLIQAEPETPILEDGENSGPTADTTSDSPMMNSSDSPPANSTC
jgi:hypothetical protein